MVSGRAGGALTPAAAGRRRGEECVERGDAGIGAT
jgi:hypothetical protein